MAADPLGLVYSGQDGTGAAFKAPWTSYDPYRAEVMRGAQLADVAKIKAKQDEEKTKELYKNMVFDASTFSRGNLATANVLNAEMQDMLGKRLAASGGQVTPEILDMAARFKTRNTELVKSLNDQGSLWDKSRAVITSPGAEKYYDVEESSKNLGVFTDPYSAPKTEYPQVQQQLADIEKQVRANNPYITDKSAKAEAEYRWRTNYGSQYAEPIRRWDQASWRADAQSLVDKAAQETRIREGNLDYWTEKKKEEFSAIQADSLVTNSFNNVPGMRNYYQKMYNSLPQDQKDKLLKMAPENPVLQLAKNEESDLLTRNNYEKLFGGDKGKGNSLGFDTPDGVIVTAGENDLNYTYAPLTPGGVGAIDPATDRGFTIAVGTKTNKKEPQFKTSGTTYYSIKDITNPQEVTSTGDFTFQRVVKKPTLTEPITISLSDLRKIGGAKFMGYDVKALVKQAGEEGGQVTIDAAGIPLSKSALSTLRALKKGDLIQDKVYVFGDLEFDETDADEQTVIKKVKGVYLPEEDVRTPLTQELQGYDYLTDLNQVYPDNDYRGAQSSTVNEPKTKPPKPAANFVGVPQGGF